MNCQSTLGRPRRHILRKPARLGPAKGLLDPFADTLGDSAAEMPRNIDLTELC
jgi:hypothetical protein